MRTLLVIVVSAILITMGCGSGDDEAAANDLAACKAAGGCGADGGGGGNDGGASWIVIAKAPDGFVGDFYFGDPEVVALWWSYACHFDGDKSCVGEVEDPRTLACKGKSECEISANGPITIEFWYPKHLFVPKTISVNGNVQVVWDKPGDWGLAPNGVYYEEQSQYEAPVKTWVKGQQILLDHDGSTIGAVTGSTFAWTEDGTTYAGTISADLKTIAYHQVGASGNEFDVDLTLVE